MRPLGLDYSVVQPITTTHVHRPGHGEELGIEEGWIMTHIDGEDIQRMFVEDVFQTLFQHTNNLPSLRDTSRAPD